VAVEGAGKNVDTGSWHWWLLFQEGLEMNGARLVRLNEHKVDLDISQATVSLVLPHGLKGNERGSLFAVGILPGTGETVDE